MRDVKRLRYIEIDILRGIAIVNMVVFHLLFDLTYFEIISVNLFSKTWLISAFFTRFLFLFLVGLSLFISRRKDEVFLFKNDKQINIKSFKRGLKILFWALFITLVTWIFARKQFVVFGILHFIGVFIIISPIFFIYHRLIFIAIPLIFFLWYIFKGIDISNFFFYVLGLSSNKFNSFDYFPLAPWLIVPLTGILFGQIFYKDFKQRFAEKKIIKIAIFRYLAKMGKNSLLIYLIHQPVIIIICFIIYKIKVS
jgi:uncharacterized membrane protein